MVINVFDVVLYSLLAIKVARINPLLHHCEASLRMRNEGYRRDSKIQTPHLGLNSFLKDIGGIGLDYQNPLNALAFWILEGFIDNQSISIQLIHVALPDPYQLIDLAFHAYQSDLPLPPPLEKIS